jgi:hypothetical protein
MPAYFFASFLIFCSDDCSVNYFDFMFEAEFAKIFYYPNNFLFNKNYLFFVILLWRKARDDCLVYSFLFFYNI